jgi:L-idonate 5-dehydrogenase
MLACVAHGARDLRIDDLPEGPPAAGSIAVDIEYGGICGSDLHYYHRGRVGDFVIQQPLVLGHEVVGRVRELGAGVEGPAVGTAVAIHPATPCNECPECLDGRRNVCRNTRYLGSAARFPHVQGGFSGILTVRAEQVVPLPEGLSLRRAAVAEPLSVALHAVSRAGDVAGRRVLVTGAGPIGCLVVAALVAAGAAEIVVSDLVDEALAVATASGATSVVRADRPDDANWPDDVDVAIEASGSPAGLRSCIERVRRGGTVVQLGLLPPGDTAFPGNLVVTREISVVGAFRFDHEFQHALDLLAGGLEVDAVLTHVLPLTDAVAAFDLAGDRQRACKVLLDFRPAPE